MIWLETHVGVVLGTGLVLVAAVLILGQRRTPQSTLAWLLFFVAVPYVAVPVFLALGIRKRGARPREAALGPPPRALTDQPDIARTVAGFGLPPAAPGHRLVLLLDGRESFEEVMALVHSARSTLDVAFYLIADDAVGRTFVDALAEAAARGVRVRLLIDFLGGFLRPRRALSALRAAGGEVRNFSPLLRRPEPGHLNLRNHRKMIVADGVRVMGGGRNVGADYMGPEPDPARWRDLSYLLSGPAVATHLDVFASDWRTAGGARAPQPRAVGAAEVGSAVAQLVPSGPDLPHDGLHDTLVQAIHAARRRVWVVTPYALPTEPQGLALATAARRGVDVRLIVPDRSNHRVADFARGTYLRALEAAGCRVLRHPGMIHAKAGVIDEAAWVGSANLDVRSMLLNFEMVLFVHDAASVGEVAGWLDALAPLCAEGTRPAGPARRVAEGVFRLGAPLL